MQAVTMGGSHLAVVVLAAIVSQACGVNVTLTVGPAKEIVPSLSNKLVVNCTVEPGADSGIERLTTIGLFLDNDLIANVDYASNDVVTIRKDNFSEDATFSGHLQTKDKFGYLAMEWTFPDEEATGIYECKVSGLDDKSQSITTVANETVSLADTPTAENLIPILKEHGQELAKLQQEAAKRLEIFQAFEKSFFSVSIKFNGTQYLLSKPFMRNFYMSQAICNLVGGTLAELKNAADHSRLKGFFFFDYTENPVLIGMQYQTYLKKYYYPSNNQEVTYEDWNTQPTTSDKDFCVQLTPTDWKMTKVSCDDNRPLVKFVCETKS